MSSSSDLTIDHARPTDYDAVCRLSDTLDEFHRERLPWLFTKPSVPPRSRRYFADLLDSEDSAIFVARANRVVGCAFGAMRAAPEFPVFIPQRWGVLDGLVVDATWRRRGVGKLLALAVETWAVDLGASWVELNVYEINEAARRFYEEIGYRPVSSKLRRAVRRESKHPDGGGADGS